MSLWAKEAFLNRIQKTTLLRSRAIPPNRERKDLDDFLESLVGPLTTNGVELTLLFNQIFWTPNMTGELPVYTKTRQA